MRRSPRRSDGVRAAARRAARTTSARAAPRSRWRREALFFDGDAWFEALLVDIDRARESIDLETYIFEDGPTGTRVLRALGAAAQRGVRVRLLVDGVGSAAWIRRRIPEKDGVEVRVYHPLPWLFVPKLRPSWRGPQRRHRLFLEINRRTHRKICLIDAAIAWVGSFNVDSCHCPSLFPHPWRDTGARVEGAAALELRRAFERAWKRSWSLRGGLTPPAIPWGSLTVSLRPPSGLVRLNHTARLRRRARHDLLARIRGARRRVWISSAYFLPVPRLLAALSAAAARGADVRVLVPAESDVFFMPWAAELLYHDLLRAGVRVHEYLPSMLHAKTLLVDDWLSVGSTNLNHRSFFHDLEADVVLTRRSSRRALRRAFLADLELSREIRQSGWKRRPWWQRLLGRLAVVLRHWL